MRIERLRVDSDGLTGGVKLDVTTFCDGDESNRPADYAFRTYTILQTRRGASARRLRQHQRDTRAGSDADEFTVGSFNMERFSIRR